MIRHRVCPLCNTERISFYLRCTDHLLSKEEFDLFKCSECGFIFTREYPDEKNMGRYYESGNYISHEDKAKGFISRIYFLARNIMLRKKKRIIEYATGLKKGRILDLGCGTGHFAAAMKKGGWDVTGVESNVKARNFETERFGISVINPELISSLPDRSFDCITMWHVLEHLHDPGKYADEISRLLRPRGICIAALPNSNSSDADFYGKFWAAYDLPRHLWHFNPATLKMFWEKKDFIIFGIKSLPLDVFYISILSEKNRGSRIPLIKGVLTGGVFAVKSAFNKNKCSSLVYFLRRSEDQ